MPKLRIGVIGAGSFASRRHLPALASSARAKVAAICRRDPEALAKMGDHFQVQHRYTDWQRMLDEVAMDGVLIATPHTLHYPQAKDALRRGLHVLLEKPMATSGQEARELARLAREKGLALTVALNPPYWAHDRFLRGLRESGEMGEIESADITWVLDVRHLFGKTPVVQPLPGVVPPTLFRGDPAASGGGFFMDGGSHAVSEILWVSGQRVSEVTALMDDPGMDLQASVSLRLEGGRLAHIAIIGSSEMSRKRQQHVFYGSKATAIVEGPPFTVTVSYPEGPVQTYPESDLPAPPSPVEDFIAAVLDGSSPLGSPDHALHVAEIVEAAYRSARAGAAVAVSTVE
ncbi:MAG: Gfo/Idh/MocA family oxidoreductase [Armatimonadetes bacterium]|nr:Gfo/Idh/MocA family oxidoreductase [Armatimonadota bacterium]